MVPMKREWCEDRASSFGTQPALTLQDWSQEPGPRRRIRRRPVVRVENLLLATAAAAVLLFFCFTAAASLFHSVRQRYDGSLLPKTVIISKTVARGDTLTRLATRYGDPNIYLLQREDQIARANHLAGTSPLLPGQHLRIPVTNPVMIARILRASNHALVASR